jgi:hypothetical protein
VDDLRENSSTNNIQKERNTGEEPHAEPSAVNVGCSNNKKNVDDKATTTVTTSTLANDSPASISITTTATATNIAVYRLGGTDTWVRRNCKSTTVDYFA